MSTVFRAIRHASTLIAAAALAFSAAGTAIADPYAPIFPGTVGPPQPVAVGQGSYASVPPADANGDVWKTLAMPLSIVDPGERPIPTSKWWTNLLVGKYTGRLWSFPAMVDADQDGAKFYFPVRWGDDGRDPVSDSPLTVTGLNFNPINARAKTWGDWTLSFRLGESDERYIDITVGRGMPYTWFEYKDVQPVLESSESAFYFDDAGKPITFPYTGDHFGMSFAGRSYGVFAPDQTTFSREGNRIVASFTGAGSYLVVCALPHQYNLPLFYQYAYAIPRDSRLRWAYNPDRAQVLTHWIITTELLKGTEKKTIQGWLPHHYRDTTGNLSFTDFTYRTPRGTMKCSIGNDFLIVYPFTGFLPFLPAPERLGLPNDYDPSRMRQYVDRYSAKTDYGDDTYWGGKSLTQYADYMAMAYQMHDSADAAKLHATLRNALADWYTYTPGEKAHYFAYYPNWRALIGIKDSYGSESFNDNHFHYGYFTRATAILGFYDPDFLAAYGPMARLVAKEYANWDRSDTRFPFLRMFDVWEGHSWAGGFSSPTGNNQESSSEAVQSWGGLYLLGIALGDKDMTAAGAMGYAMESRAAMEYWFNVHGDNFSPNYKWPIAGMVWGGGQLFGTYFSGDPAWVYAIQWLPMSPMMDYLVKDPEFAQKSFNTMLEMRKAKQGTADFNDMGTGLGNVVLSQAQQINPDWTSGQLDALWDSGSPVAHDNDTPGITYYLTHSDRMLGRIQWDYHMSLALSCVYQNERTGVISYVVFNPGAQPQTVTVYKGAQKVGTITAPAKTLTRVTSLAP